MNDPEKLTFKTVDAISVGGSYIVGEDGKPVRQPADSTSLESIAKGAPGPDADAKGAPDGVALAHSEASAVAPAAPPAPAAPKGKA